MNRLSATLFRSSRAGALMAQSTALSLALLVLGFAVSQIQCFAQQASRAEREAAVAQARAGDPRGGLATLRLLVSRFPADARLLADAAIVASWAGEDAYVMQLFDGPNMPKDDAGVTEAAARAARNLHQYPLAGDLYKRASRLATDRWQPILGEALVLIDIEDYEAAAVILKELLRSHPNERDVLSGEAYLCSREEDFACIIDMDQRLIALGAGNPAEAECALSEALSKAGAETLARDSCARPDFHLDLQLRASAGAERIRWAESKGLPWPQRKKEAEDALALLDGVAAESKPTDSLWIQAESDRILALSDLNRNSEVIHSYERLRKMNLDVPDYALERVAGCYLALRAPQKAFTLYTAILQHAPQSGDALGGLAYAEMEREHLRQSLQTIDKAFQDAPPWLKTPGLKVPQSNPFYAGLGMQAALMRGFLNLPRAEQNRLGPLVDRAPASSELHRAMALTYVARGWPWLARKEEQIADGYAQPDELPVLEQGQIFEAAGLRDRTDELIAPLLMREGHSLSIDKFLRERAIDRGWMASLAEETTVSNGRFIGTTNHAENHVDSPLLGNRWRVYEHSLGDTGDFPKGSVWRMRAALGMSFDYAQNSVAVEVGEDRGTAGGVIAGAIKMHLALGDRWSLQAKGDTDSMDDVQLIAQLGGYRARSADLTLDWHSSDTCSGSAKVQRQLYSDGNQRSSFTAAFDQRAWTGLRVQVDVTPEIYASANSKNENRIYFNPRSDVSGGVGVITHWLTWRSYERSFRQDFTFLAAPSWQQNYGTGALLAMTYAQDWRLGYGRMLQAHATWNSQPYSGSTEPYTALGVALTW